MTSDSKHECFKKFCTFCNKKQPSGHLCYVAPLKPNKLSNKYLYVFFDTECTQDLEKCDGSWEPKLIMDGSKILSMVVENFHFWIR